METEPKKGVVPEGGFRCPFEIKGEREGAIIEVSLDDDRQTRLHAFKKGLEMFHESPNSPGLKFIMPDSLQESVHSNTELKTAMIPYQSELLGTELAYRLSPFLAFQRKGMSKEDLYPLFQTAPYKLAAAQELESVIKQCGFKDPMSAEDIADFIEAMIKDATSKGIKNPMFKINTEIQGQPLELITISSGQITLHPERYPASGSQNKNCFGIVKSPFYPKEFGRYSPRVEAVMSRESDFASLPTETRQKIRRASNTVLQSHGIEISDIDDDKPEGDGVWIPDYKNEN